MKFTSKDNLNSFTAKLKAWIKARKIKASDLDSTGATAGQVPTADGSGGVSYQDPSGGGAEHLYWHTVTLQFQAIAMKYAVCVIISTSPTLPTRDDIFNILAADGEIAIMQGVGYDVANSKYITPMFLIPVSGQPTKMAYYYFQNDDDTFAWKSEQCDSSNIGVMPTLSKTHQIF